MSGIGTMTTTTSETVDDQTELGQPQELTPQILPYAFAKRHGVLIGQIEDDQVQLLHRPDFRPTKMGLSPFEVRTAIAVFSLSVKWRIPARDLWLGSSPLLI